MSLNCPVVLAPPRHGVVDLRLSADMEAVKAKLDVAMFLAPDWRLFIAATAVWSWNSVPAAGVEAGLRGSW